ncbi:Hpt domain-containing protein [Vibrio sp. V39_P1S14PM300]|uniref:Hpt domain-containing protein n=1 Tax=Vibrio sp. V39_P1S14PM300 TaxID=1938690 RepID=UPI0013724DFA|nr:Hpt domain-containing protein [Vibrio sp. V39_P1S14PM300]NAX23331.1 hypothetical protein [Vibrio sp. V39_P1S14PM300]
MEGRIRQRRLIWLLAILWLALSSLVLFNDRTLVRTMTSIEELSHSVESITRSLYYDTSYRARGLSELELKVQLLYSLKLNLEAQESSGMFAPDVSQLIYLTQRFLDLGRSFISSETELLALADTLKALRVKYAEVPQLSGAYYRLSAYVFDAMFVSIDSHSEAYRDLDRLLALSYQLPGSQQKELQQTLAQAATILGDYAKGSHVVDQLLNHPIHAEILTLENQHHRLLSLHLMFLVLIGFVFVAAILAVVSRLDNETMAGPPLAGKSEEPEQLSDLPMEKKDGAVSSEPQQQIRFEHMLDSLSGDQESVNLLLQVFVQDHYDDVEAMRSLINVDPDSAMRKAHSLKGVASNLGADILRDAALIAETKLKQGERLTREELDHLAESLRRAIGEAQSYIAAHKATGGGGYLHSE